MGGMRRSIPSAAYRQSQFACVSVTYLFSDTVLLQFMSETAIDTSISRADAARNRGRILEAATALLMDDPHAGMAEIARAAGVTRVTVNRHFRTRENLMAAVFERVLASGADMLRAARLDEGPAPEAIERLIRGWLELDPPVPPLEVLDQGAAHLPADVRAHYFDEVLGQPVVALMDRGRSAGELADMPPEWMAAVLGATLRAAFHTLHADRMPRDEVAALTSRAILGAIGADTTTTTGDD